jgi:multidrug efflux pump subunit AcrA (membrane-fusion protein)
MELYRNHYQSTTKRSFFTGILMAMKKLLKARSLAITLAVVIIIAVLGMMFGFGKNQANVDVTATVERGDVRQLVSVSGVAEAEQSAELAFPVTGIISSVSVTEGDEVEAGDVLVTLESRALQADRQDAVAALQRAVADRDELLAGPSTEARSVTTESVTLAEEALQTTRENENRKIANAKRALLSTNLTAFSDDDDEDALPPTVSGTYGCDAEGTYELEVFRSSAQSGFSYRLSGLETGIFVGSVDQAVPLGNCGLRIQFDLNSNYFNTEWTIEIPNSKSSAYTAALNAYNLAVTQAESAITLAEQEVALAEANATNSNAPARIEAVARANADVAQAQARLERIDATIADRVLRAPFSGTITDIDVLPGETVTSEPIVTLLAASDFEVTARIPEIDIGKLLIGQPVEMIFDARAGEVLTGKIDFISLQATEIDGVAYYEAIITLSEIPPWIRSGLNADIDIIIEEVKNQLRVKKRFVTETESGFVVITKVNGVTATSSVEVTLEGNDGYVAITGVDEGSTVVAP